MSAGYEQGGVENGIVLSNKVLRDHGYDVTVISSDYRSDLEHFSDIEFKAVPQFGVKKLFYTAYNPEAYKIVKSALETYSPDVVLLHTMMQVTASILFLLKAYPTIQFVHGPEMFTKTLLPWYMSRQDFRGGSYATSNLTLLGRMHYMYFLLLCRPLYLLGFHNVNRIISLSSYTQAFLGAEGIHAEYMPNGAELLKVKSIAPRKPVILYAGRLEEFKGVQHLINAMPEILRHSPEAILKIAGDGEYAKQLKTLAKKLALETHIEFLGHLDQPALRKVYSRFSVLVLPSTWPETFGKVGIEAMSTGRPVVATDVGGVKDWLSDGENGFLVEPGKPDQIAEKVTVILNNSDLAKRLGAEGKSTAKQFTIKSMTHNLEKLIKDVTT